MIWAGRRVARRAAGHDDDDDAQLMLFVAALVACVVTSPTGWVMGLVWALPIAPLVLRDPNHRDRAALVAARDGRGRGSRARCRRRSRAGRRWRATTLAVAAGAVADRVAARMIVLAASLLALAVVGVSLARLDRGGR